MSMLADVILTWQNRFPADRAPLEPGAPRRRAGLADTDLATLSTLLGHLAANVGAGEVAASRAGLADRRLE
jgi:hypothetical protein